MEAFINVVSHTQLQSVLINGKMKGRREWVSAFINDDTWHCMVGYGESDVADTRKSMSE